MSSPCIRTTVPPTTRRGGPVVSHPHDATEQQAEKAAEVVARGGSVAGWSFASVPTTSGCDAVNRQESTGAKKRDDAEEYQEAGKKVLEAVLETPEGKRVKELVLADPLVKTTTDFFTTPVGLATGGLLLGGALGGLAAAKRPLPFQLPAVPLEKIHPALSGVTGQVVIEGPLNAPTFVGLTLTFGGGSSSSSRRAPERPVQRHPAGTSRRAPVLADLAPVDAAVAGTGRPLEARLRRSMEAQFGYDFSAVRLHDDAAAHQAAESLDADAFTLGGDIGFAAGHLDPDSARGRRLIAHELTHVVQQRGRAGAPIHRQKPGGPVAPVRKGERDVVVMLLHPPRKDLAATVAPGAEVLTATTPEQLAAELKKISYPIGTVYVVSHGLASGDIGFESADATTYVLPSKLAKALTGSVKPGLEPTVVDFQSCSVGTAPEALEAMRTALGAKSAVGGTCFLWERADGPVSIGGKAITRKSQVSKANRSAFEAGLKMLGRGLGAAEPCIVERTEEAYFRTGGKWIAQWYDPDLGDGTFGPKSVCRNKLKPTTVDPKAPPGRDEPECRVIRVGGTP